MSDRLARFLIAALTATLSGAVLSIDLPKLTRHSFWSDGATYYSMALSLARDGDLRYEARDVLRVRREYGAGPEGIFLKRSSGGLALTPEAGFPWFSRIPEQSPRIYFAKAFAYPVAAAPFVALAGLNGLLFFNVLCLGVTLFLGYTELRRRTAPGAALALAGALVIGGVTPVYLLWLQPEMFNLALVTGGLVAWSRDRPMLSAVLLGIATYSKPTNALLALPLGVAPLLMPNLAGFLEGLEKCASRAAVVVLTAGALYGLNATVTGEFNYQGGERKTFYGRFPFEQEVTFGNSGIWMTSEHFGPLVEGEDDALATRASGPTLQALELREAFRANLGYFWYGRYAGALLYFFPVALAVLAFPLWGPRDLKGLLALAAFTLSFVVYIWFIPANWYGGGGAVGNRYFLSLVPLALWLVPRGRERRIASVGLAGALIVSGPILASPLYHSLHPGRQGMREPFPRFPAELTMINDLSFNIDNWRKKVPFGDHGDLGKNWPADPKAYSLYFPDDGAHGKEVIDGIEGVRLERGQRAELLLRAFEPVNSIEVRAAPGAPADAVTICAGAACGSLAIDPARPATLRLEPGRGLLYYDSFVYVIELRAHTASDPFLSFKLDVAKRAKGKTSP